MKEIIVEETNGFSIIMRISQMIVRVMLGIALAFLSLAAFYNTWYCQPEGGELVVARRDSLLFHGLLFFVIVTVGYFWNKNRKQLSKLSVFLESERFARAILGISIVWVVSFLTYWMLSADRQPHADAWEIYKAAEYILDGSNASLLYAGYLGKYPFQIPLVAIFQTFYKLFGVGSYKPYQWMCCLFAVGIYLLGYQIVGIYQKRARNLYCLFMNGCFPLYIYTTWVYGDVPFLFFSLVGFFCLIQSRRDEKKGRIWWLAGMAAAFTLAVWFRSNAWIFIIAAGIICILLGLERLFLRQIREAVCLMFAIVAMLVIPMVSSHVIQQKYLENAWEEFGFEYELYGIPTLSWIAMGMQESPWGSGWYTTYSVDMYESLGYDQDAIKEAAKGDIDYLLSEFFANPSYALSFYSNKFLTQWNTPLYQAVAHNTVYGEGDEPASDSFLVYLTKKEGYWLLLGFSEILQLLIFVGCFLFVLLWKIRKPQELLLPTAILGVMFFSLLWEAKARYNFPTYVLMFPLAAIGWKSCIDQKAKY